jgi:hypothetical protein
MKYLRIKFSVIVFMMVVTLATAAENDLSSSGLVGTWNRECKVSGAYISDSQDLTLTFQADGHVTTIVNEYRGKICEKTMLLRNDRLVGDSVIGSSTIVFGKIMSFVTLYDPGVVSFYNSNKYCGATDWSLGIEHSACYDIPGSSAADIYQYSIKENILTVEFKGEIIETYTRLSP